MSLSTPPKALFFDVFGTVVEWRSCVTKALNEAAQRALSDPHKHLPAAVHAQASAMTVTDWQALTDEWRASYSRFTKTFDPSSHGFIPVDQHHYTALHRLLEERGIASLFTDEERWGLALSWHRLDPWPDSVRGLELLNRRFRTCTLSNGNIALLEDLARHGPLPFNDIVSAEHFGVYKPSPTVYLGAAGRLGLEPGECALVAAHLSDLKAAKGQGFQTVYVERWQEETLDVEALARAKGEGYVDMWIDLSSEGLVEIARRFA